MMPRATPEWIAKTPNSKVPPRVSLRILRAYDNRCYLSGREIRPGDVWELEHKVALILGGEHRETNLAPALAEFHKSKTAAEMKIKAKTDTLAKKHLGIAAEGPKLQGAPFRKTLKSAAREAKARDKLPTPKRPRQLYEANHDH